MRTQRGIAPSHRLAGLRLTRHSTTVDPPGTKPTLFRRASLVRPTAIRDAALLVDQLPLGVLGVELIMTHPDRLGTDETHRRPQIRHLADGGQPRARSWGVSSSHPDPARVVRLQPWMPESDRGVPQQLSGGSQWTGRPLILRR